MVKQALDENKSDLLLMPTLKSHFGIEVDAKVVGDVKLPKTLVLYAVDAGHFVLSAKPLAHLDESALTKAQVPVTTQNNKYLLKLPLKIYNFYKMDESDYTVITSNKDPSTIIITV